MFRLFAIVVVLLAAVPAIAPAEEAARVKVLFLGDNGHHKPAERFAQLAPVMKQRGVDLTYTDRMSDLNPDTLNQYDGLMIYANETHIAPEQEKAMIEYVRGGGGLIPIHCASYCFHNSPQYIKLVGGQFQKHKTGTFSTRIVDPNHPIMKGFKPFETWDETYVHTKLGEDIHVLQVRPESVEGGYGGDGEEPWTWVRSEGEGRVFYTAYGHDHRTWGNPGFQDLIERGTRWATRTDAASAFDRPRLVGPDPDAKPFEYVTAEGIPFYEPGGKPFHAGGTWNQMPTPLSPEESKKHMILPEGFEAKLFVAEPDVIKPLTMAWDERGRLWVVESFDYPNRVTGPGGGNDRIKICEDTDGDGRADKFSVFAEGLNIPCSITFANGGIIVPESKSTWFLKDTDGDGKADVKQELFTGWYPRQMDTHAGPNNFRYGLDNWIWGMVGYGSFDGTVGGKSLRFQQGFLRFKPDGSALEYLRSTSNNTWGIGFSDEGIIFGSTANGCPSVYLPIPNRYYESVRGGWAPGVLKMISPHYLFDSPNPKVRQVDWHGGYTAAAGHALYTARAYPKEYWNRTAFVAEPTGHIVGTFVLEPQGSDFKSYNPFNLLASMDEWTSPIMAEVGPDGFVWVIDWYAYIVQHNPTPQGYENGPGNAYVTPRRDDHKHGRIYRIVYSGATPGKSLDLSKAAPAGLVSALRNDNQLWRLHAQRLLVEKQDKSVVGELIKLATDQSVDEIDLNVGAIHALWTLKGLGALDGANEDALAAAVAALNHPSAGVRRNAVQVLPPGEQTLRTILDAKLLDDPDAQVRLMTLLAIADQPSGSAISATAGAAVYAALRKPENLIDRWIPDAAVAAAAKHDAAFLHAALARSAKQNAAAPAPAPSTQPQAKSAGAKQPQNLIVNGSFEDVQNGGPVGWRAIMHAGRGTLRVDSTARTGARSAMIASAEGGDVSWSQDVRVKPNTRYRLSAWVKTRSAGGDGLGALFNVHELQRQGAATPLRGDNDWTELTGEFATGERSSITINMLFGGWGRATGEAWYDNVQLIELGPADPATLATAGETDKLAQAVKIVARHYAEGAPADTIVATLDALKGVETDVAENVLDGLVAGWPDRADAAPSFSDAEKRRITMLGEALSADQRDRLLVLANRWGQSDIFAGQMDEVLRALEATLGSAGASPAERADAAKRMIRLRDDPATIKTILAQVTPQASSELSRMLILALADSREDAVAGHILAKSAILTPAARAAAVSVMMRRVPWTNAMLKAIQERKLTRGDLTASDWQTLKTHRDRGIALLARKLDTTETNPDRLKVLEAMRPALEMKGDIAVGQKLFTQLCAQCHTFNGQGGNLGPDLTGIASRGPTELLAEIIDPNRSVEANYRAWDIETKSRDHFSGRLNAETQTTVELLDATGQRHVIQRENIRSMTASNFSVMPVGLVDTLKHEEVASLLEYLKTGHPPQPK
ncbi:MAG TPA: PVC-type heme-binding CxxCH protein [Tepidisphaeraceae bacterium]|nr:PVC-type heme-binding CxxCH protein [Tepidisphaeraceae bacterium]